MDLLLIRHAQTHSNVSRALDTEVPGADLTELGESQVRELTELLAAERLDSIWSSPTLRTRRTADGLARPRGLEVRIRDGLKEISAGDWEMSTDEQHAIAYRDVIVALLEGSLDARVPGGESGAELLSRFDAVVEEIRASGDERAAIISHGAILRTWCGFRVQNVVLDVVRERPLGNTGVVRLRSDDRSDNAGQGWVATEWDQQAVAVGGEAGPSAEPA